MNKKIFYIKMIIAVIVSLSVSGLLIRDIFLVKSPKVRPHLDIYFGKKYLNTSVGVKKILSSLSRIFTVNIQNTKNKPAQNNQNENEHSFISEAAPQSIKDSLVNIPFTKSLNGIYTKVDQNFSYTLIKEKEVVWVEEKVIINGKGIQIVSPKGSKPIKKELIEPFMN